MPPLWCSARRWIVFGAAAWLAGGGAYALLPARAAEPTQPTGGRPTAMVVANPFVVAKQSFPQRPASPLGLTTTSWIAVTGEMVNGDVPALYRLPGAPSYTSGLVEPFVAGEPPPAPAAAPASPPLVRDRVGDDSPRVAQRETAPSSPWPATAARAANQPVGGVSDADDRGQRPLPQHARAQRPLPPHTPKTTSLTPQLLPAVQRGYTLAQRGAMYAARAEFVQVLGRVVQAKDAAANSDAHSRALAAGLRAIDEAEDFVPSGVRVDAELDVRIVSSSHRTPVLSGQSEDVSPHEAVALYHRYAQQQLAVAVAGEQAGSMALHGLGKVSATLADRGSGDPALMRSAMTMYSAALATCPMNHLAANELGVLLVREGRVAEAARLFEVTIGLAPSATAYHNLAIAQGKLGFHGHAAANEQESQRLAAMERATGVVSRRAGIEWVTPDQMSGVAQPGLTPTAQVPPQPKSRWQKTVDMAKSLPFPGASKMK